MKQNTSIKNLWLAGNKLGDEGARILSDMLKENTTLTELSLRDNSVGSEGVVHLENSLHFNYSLQGLDLTGMVETFDISCDKIL